MGLKVFGLLPNTGCITTVVFPRQIFLLLKRGRVAIQSPKRELGYPINKKDVVVQEVIHVLLMKCIKVRH